MTDTSGGGSDKASDRAYIYSCLSGPPLERHHESAVRPPA
ncbi:hypothetical protein ACP70R_024274 [Stipagrostis hirtigluma subsp. patula]